MLGHTNGTGARPTTAMGSGKSLMKIQVQHIHAAVSHMHHPHDGIHIGPIAIHLPTFGMNNIRDLFDVLFKQPQGVGVGDHDAGRILIHHFGNGFSRQDSPVAGLHTDRTIPAQGRAGGIGAMGRIRNNDLVPLHIAAFEISMDQQHTGQFTLGSGCRLQTDRVHSGNLLQKPLQLNHQPQGALGHTRRQHGVQSCKTFQLTALFIDLGVVLHGTGP